MQRLEKEENNQTIKENDQRSKENKKKLEGEEVRK